MDLKTGKFDPKGVKTDFFQKFTKIAETSQLGLLLHTSVTNTLELHQFAQQPAQLMHFLYKKILTLGSRPPLAKSWLRAYLTAIQSRNLFYCQKVNLPTHTS